jgi:hypothetical protein
MMFDTLRSFAESVVTSVIMGAFAALRNLFQILTAHRLILLGLLASVLFNVFISSKESLGWWKERRAARFMSRIGVGPNTVMSRAVYFHDINEATGGAIHPLSLDSYPPWDSVCFTTFQVLSNSTDMDAPAQDAGAALALTSTSSKSTARRLRRTRQRLGGQRHDLMVAMRLVNSIEREVVRSEWENWLGDENMRCERMRAMLETEHDKEKAAGKAMDSKATDNKASDSKASENKASDSNGPSGEKIEELREWYDGYCGSCRSDMRALTSSRAAEGA